ncbi:MAG: hypothetical protein OXC19_14385 [Bryobacterales bacterium]|nr:hypothetical protein [Bryobacterales bacterium]
MGTGFPDLKPWADAWLDRIGAVFHLARRRQAWQPGLPLDGQDATFRSRQEQLQAAFDGLFQTAREELLELRVPRILELNRPHPHGGELARLEARSAPLLSLLEHREGLGVSCATPERHSTTTLANAFCEARSSLATPVSDRAGRKQRA